MPSVGVGRAKAAPRADPSGGGGASSLAECPSGEMWQQVAPGELGSCERTCQEPNATETLGNCSAGQVPGCVCQHGLLRSQAGLCVPTDHCECWRHGHPYPVRHHSPSVPPSHPQPRPPSIRPPSHQASLWSTDSSPYARACPNGQLGHQLSHWDSLWALPAHLPPEVLLLTSASGHCSD